MSAAEDLLEMTGSSQTQTNRSWPARSKDPYKIKPDKFPGWMGGGLAHSVPHKTEDLLSTDGCQEIVSFLQELDTEILLSTAFTLLPMVRHSSCTSGAKQSY